MKTQFRIAVVAAVVFLSSFLTSCGGGSGGGGTIPPVIAVAISPSAPQTVTGGKTIAFTATVTNDPSSAGVSWTLAGDGALSNQTATSATYTAPPTIALQSTATVTATSVTDKSKSASTTITLLTPPPVIITTTLPAGSVGAPYTATIMTTGGNPPLTFSITKGALPAGLVLASTTGVISGKPSASGMSSFTVTVTDSSTPVQTGSANLSITVTSGQLVITTTTLPGGITGQPYSAQIMTSGGVPPITFALTSGSLPVGLTLSSSGLISGTPTGMGTSSFTVLATDSSIPPQTAAAALGITVTPAPLTIVTPSPLPGGYLGIAYSQAIVVTGGVQPYTWSILSGGLPNGLSLDTATGVVSGTPTELITTSFQIQVVDSNTPPTKIKQQFKLTIFTAGTAVLKGQYAFQAAGFDPTNNQVAYVGSFTSDGMDNITGGVEDINDNGVVTASIPITGTFVVYRDNRGALNLNLATTPPTTQVFTFAMSSTGQIANMIEFDTANQASGTFQLQNPAAFSLASLAGDYAYGLATSQPPVGGLAARSGQVGRFTVDSSGNLSNGGADTNENGANLSNLTLTGSFAAPDSNTGRGAASLTPGTQTAIGLTYYIVQQGLVFSMENDANGGASVYSGSIITQQGAGSFNANSLSGTVVFEAGGVDMGGSSVIAGQFTATPGTLILAGELDENDAGLVLTATPFTDGTYSVALNGRGTLSLVDSSLKHYYDAVFYLTAPNTGFLLDAGAAGNNYIRSGTMLPQTGGPFTSAPNDGNYYGGSYAPTTAGPLHTGKAVDIPNIDDQFALVTGALTGIGDISDFNTQNTLSLSGTYTFGDTFGRATLNVPVPGFGGGMATIYMATPTQFVMIPTDQFSQNSNIALFQTQ